MMSMQLWVFSARQLTSIADWQAAIDAEGYPLRLDPEMQIDRLSGFLPTHLRGELTGFECYHDDVDEFWQQLKLDPDLKFALGFVWLGSRESELLAAWMAGTAYAVATDGVVYDSEAGKLRTPAEARAIVYDFEHPSPETLAAIQEIKRRLAQES